MVVGLLAVAIAAVATGVARDALAHFVAEAGRSVPQASTKPLGSRATVQDAVARADASLQAARCYLLASVEAAWQAAQRSEPVPLEARRHLRQAATHAVQTSAEVVTRVYTLGGGGAVFAASPLQRALRNVQVAGQHMMVNDATWELTGRLLLGVPTQTQML